MAKKKSKKCDIERIGIFLGPKGFMDFERDTVHCASLEKSRELAAQNCFEESDLPELEDCDNGWTRDGIFWSKTVYWEKPDGLNEEEYDDIDSRGSFGVQFRPNTAEIVDVWWNA